MRITSLCVNADEGTTDFEFIDPVELHNGTMAYPLWISGDDQQVIIWLSKESANRLRAALDARFPVAEPVAQKETHAQN